MIWSGFRHRVDITPTGFSIAIAEQFLLAIIIKNDIA